MGETLTLEARRLLLPNSIQIPSLKETRTLRRNQAIDRNKLLQHFLFDLNGHLFRKYRCKDTFKEKVQCGICNSTIIIQSIFQFEKHLKCSHNDLLTQFNRFYAMIQNKKRTAENDADHQEPLAKRHKSGDLNANITSDPSIMNHNIKQSVPSSSVPYSVHDHISLPNIEKVHKRTKIAIPQNSMKLFDNIGVYTLYHAEQMYAN